MLVMCAVVACVMPPATGPSSSTATVLAGAGEEIGRGQAGDAGADDADVDVQVFLQG